MIAATERAFGPVRRVLVGLDSADEAEALIDLATRLAGAMRVELAGLFLEDRGLLDLAALPCARVVARGGFGARPIGLEEMERALRRQATAFERALSRHAERARLAWSFGRVRGDVSIEIRQAACQGDLVVLHAEAGEAAASLAAARMTCADAFGVALVGRVRRSRGRVVLLEASEAAPASRALEVAAAIAAAQEEELLVLVASGSAEAAERIEARLRARVPAGVRFAARRLVGASRESLAVALREAEPLLLVADLDDAAFGDEASARLLFRAAQAPVLLVRREPGGPTAAP